MSLSKARYEAERLPDLTPSQVYSSQDSTQAIEKATFFLEETRKLIEGVWHELIHKELFETGGFDAACFKQGA